MKKLIVVLSFLFCSTSFAKEDCSNHPIYCKILKYKRGVDKTWAMNFSNKLVSKAKASHVDPNIALAILLQESMLENVNTFKSEQNTERHCDDKGCYKITTVIEKAFDISIAQINVNTARHYKFDVERLFLLDQDYALDCFFIVLKDKIKMCSDLRRPWSCYHSITPNYRLVYAELVERYLK